MAHYILNEKLNGVEIYFDSKPEDSIRSEMKSAGFRWSQRQGMWYAKQSETTLAIAKKLGEQGKEVVRPVKPETVTCPKKANQCEQFDYDVKVGDLFVHCFGYDATLHDFYEVVELKGKQTVILREVCKQNVGSRGFCAWQVKPLKGKFDGDETVTCRLRKNGSSIYAGKFYKADWNMVFDEDDYH